MRTGCISTLFATIAFIRPCRFDQEKPVSLAVRIFAFFIHLTISHIEDGKIKGFDEHIDLPCSGQLATVILRMDAANVMVDLLRYDDSCNLQKSVFEGIIKRILVECRI